jgi:hypothetical protein
MHRLKVEAANQRIDPTRHQVKTLVIASNSISLEGYSNAIQKQAVGSDHLETYQSGVSGHHSGYRTAASTLELQMSLSGLGSCSYELDDDLRIIAVDAAWSEFAIANGAPELVPPTGLLGQPVLSYVADLTTTLLYEQLFSKVQRTGDSIAVPFRCDAPSLRRFLELQIERLFPSGLLLHSTVLRVEERSEVPLLDRPAP